MKKVKDWIIAFGALCIFVIGTILLFDGHWIWGVVLSFPSLLVLVIFLSELVHPTNYNSSNNTYYTSGYNNIWLEKRKGYNKFTMVGMYYRNLKFSDMGKFEGYAIAERNNMYDTYAVAIYTNSGKHLGYLPSGNKTIHQLIIDSGKPLPAYGYVSCNSYGSNFTAEVGIKTNLVLNTDNLFYDQNITIIGRFRIPQKDLTEKLRKLGAYVGRDVYEHTNIVLIGEKIKSTKTLKKLEALIMQGCNIRKIYRDELETILKENE